MCKKDASSAAEWDADFYVSIEKVSGGSSGPDQLESAGGDDKNKRSYRYFLTQATGSKGEETWTGKDTTLSYIETNAFAIPDNDSKGDNMKLTDYRLKVRANRPGDTAPSQMWISNRDMTLPMDLQGDTFTIDLSKFPLYDKDFGDMNIQKFTLQPYESHASGRKPGARAICVWTQVQTNDFSGDDFRIVQASSVGPAQKSYIPKGSADAVSAGGLAIHIDQNDFYGQNLIIEIDDEYDSNDNHLSMAWEDTSGLYCLDLKAEIAVTGAGRLNGKTQLLKTLAGHQDNVAAGILDLGSSVTGPTGYAVDVSGVSFVHCPRRNRSTVQLNSFPLTDRFDASTATNSYGPVKCFDTKMIAYVDASDGPTTQASDKVNPTMSGRSSFFGQNFILGADDNIKPQASGVQFLDTTILQGDAGCPINLGAYGFTNGSIARSVIHGVWIHRIMHKYTQVPKVVSDSGYGAQEDNCGGLVTNRTGFSLFGERFRNVGFVEDDDALGLADVRISRLYVPSLVDGSWGKDMNSVTRTLTLSALSNYGGYGRTYFSQSYHMKRDNQRFCIKDLSISGAVHPKRDADYLIYSTGHDDKTAIFKGKKIQAGGGWGFTVKRIYYYNIDDQGSGDLVGEVSVNVKDINVSIEPSSTSCPCHCNCSIC